VVAGLGLILLEAVVVLFVQDDQAQLGQGGKHRRAGADHHLGGGGQHLPPGVVALAFREAAVVGPHLGSQPRPKPIHQLRGKADLGHQHQRRPSLLQHLGDHLQVHFRFPRTGDPVQ